MTTTSGTSAAPAVPESLLRLLERHDPDHAARVARLSAGPPPDTVLVLGAAEADAARLAMSLAARIPGLVRAAPAVRLPRLADVRAVVWVFDSAAPTPEPHWTLLAELAGRVEEIHLALAAPAGPAAWPDPAARIDAVRDRLAQAVPRLAAAPLHLVTDPTPLVTALAYPAGHPGHRNALRLLTTALAEAAARDGDRHRNAALRAEATDAALTRRGDHLATLRRELTTDVSRARAELAALRLAASQRLDAARRELRDAARDYLDQADQAARARFPALFTSAATTLAERALADVDIHLERRFPGRLEPPTAPAAPAITPPGRSGRCALEDRMMVLVGVSGGLGVGRLLLAPLAATPAAGAGTLALSVGLGVALAGWLARVRHAATDRARLLRWAAEALADTHAAVDAALAERCLAAERGLAAPTDQATAALSARLREHDHLVRATTARRAEQAAADRAERQALAVARARLSTLLEDPRPSGLAS